MHAINSRTQIEGYSSKNNSLSPKGNVPLQMKYKEEAGMGSGGGWQRLSSNATAEFHSKGEKLNY